MSNFKKHINYHPLQLSHIHKNQKGSFKGSFYRQPAVDSNLKKRILYIIRKHKSGYSLVLKSKSDF